MSEATLLFLNAICFWLLLSSPPPSMVPGPTIAMLVTFSPQMLALCQ